MKLCLCAGYGKTEKRVLKENDEKIRKAFAHLVRQVLSILKKQTIDMEEFYMFVVAVLPPGKNILPQSEKISGIFGKISQKNLWSYVHYSPLKSIAEEFARVETQQLIEEYETELSSYYATTSLVDYIALCEEKQEDDLPLLTNPANYDEVYFRRLSVRLDTPFTDKTLQYISDLWRALARVFLLPPLTAILERIIAGSLVVTWLIPHEFALKICERAREVDIAQFFRTWQISEVKIDDEVVYYDIKVRISGYLLHYSHVHSHKMSHISVFFGVLTVCIMHGLYFILQISLIGACEEGDADKVMELLPEITDFNFSQVH